MENNTMNAFLIKTIIIIAALVVPMGFGFYVGQNYAKSLKSSSPQIHFHYGYDTSRSGGDMHSRKIPVSDPVENEFDDGKWIEFNCLAKTIYFEAGNQSYSGKLAVGYVVSNRVDSPKYPNTICEVIAQHKQFSWYADKKDLEPFKGGGWKDSVRAAKEVLTGNATLFDEEVQHYHADYVSPSWAKKMVQVAQIDDHIFYK